MEVPVLGEVVRETKSRPYTMMILVALTIAVPWIWDHVAWADEVRAIQSQLSQLNYNQQRGNLEARLQAVESEIFNLQQKIADKVKSHQPVDPLNYDRVYKLQIEKGQLERQLTALK